MTNFTNETKTILNSSQCSLAYASILSSHVTPLYHISKQKGFKLATLNVRSLLSKLDELRVLLSEKPIDILSINETFLDSSIPTSQLLIDGYNFERYDRGSRHVGFYIRDSVKYDIYKQDVITKHAIEALFIMVKPTNKKPFITGTIYRPPNSAVNYFDNIINVLDDIMADYQCIILGDLNYNYVMDESLYANPITYMSQMFGLTQLVTEPTRVTMSSSTLIDVILSTMPTSHVSTGVIQLTMSDHFMPYTIIACQSQKHIAKFITIRDFKCFNHASFISDIEQTFTNFILDDLESIDINNTWNRWKAMFEKVCSRHAPLKTIKVKDRKNPWITTDIITAIYERDYLHKKAVKEKNYQLWDIYKLKRNQIVKMINNAQHVYYSKTVMHSKNKNRDMWKSLNDILNIKKHSDALTDITADTFNTFFANVGKLLADKFYDDDEYHWNLPESIYDFNIATIDDVFVKSELSKLKDKSNLDVLNMDARLLKLSSRIVCVSLAKIINATFMTGILPDDWKCAKVTPIYKNKGSRDEASNYRPISVICHIAKIMEKAVQVQLKDYLLDHNFISHVQSAYLKDHSTQSSLLNIVSELFDGINTNNVNTLCFLDLQKCFDTIDHKILLHKMNKYGIRGRSHDFFKNYLSGRKQCVKINGELSRFLNIVYGVPQGSTLGPILFLLFINDLPTCLTKCECILFADDTAIYTMNVDENIAISDLQSDINNVAEWFQCNRLSVNVNKSYTMSVSTRSANNNILYMNNEVINNVSDTKYLGVTICSDLSWEKHISATCSKIGYGINILCRLRHKVNQAELLSVYNTIIQPYIDYCLPIWGYAPSSLLCKIQRLQNRIVRIITHNYDFNISPSVLLSQLRIMNVIQRRNYFMSIQMFKCLNGTAPSYLLDRIELSSHYNSYCTRNSSNDTLYIPKPRLEKFRQSFQYAGPTLYISLPEHVKQSTSLSSFKKNTKHHFLDSEVVF